MNKNFLSYMKELLKDDYDLYIETLNKPLHRGFNINTLKINSETLFQLEKFNAFKSTFSKNSYILNDDKTYGNSLVHALGLIYMQEPSASSVVDILDPQPHENILDMCSAPGGKSIQIAMRMENTGNLISNEYDFNRCKILLSNMERMGIRNSIITSNISVQLVKIFGGFFDRILVDAPCSGEGMFKKYPESMIEWSLNNVIACSKRQVEILSNAYYLLKEDGILVYSTCTFNQIENEGVVDQILKKFKDLQLEKIEVDFGRKGFNNDSVVRIMPYDNGEGQFIARFRKKALVEKSEIKYIESKIDDCVINFLKEIEYKFPYYLNVNNKIYASDNKFIDIKCLRNKVLIGEIIKNRFEPHHHLYLSLDKKVFKKVVNLSKEEALNYLKGNTLNIKGYKGYVAVGYQDYILGFGKGDNNIIKNKYPKGLRKG